MSLYSPVFEDGGRIPEKYTEHGENVSPPLTWTDVPAGTAELALIVEDPDAKRHSWWRVDDEEFVHWVVYKIPPSATGLPEGIRSGGEVHEPRGALQGENEEGDDRWTGPRLEEGHGDHHYRFKLYALGRPLEVNFGLDKDALESVMKGHVMETAELVAYAER